MRCKMALVYWTDDLHDYEAVIVYNLTQKTAETMTMVGKRPYQEPNYKKPRFWDKPASHRWESVEQILKANNGKSAQLLGTWTEEVQNG